MKLELDLQVATTETDVPDIRLLQDWLRVALAGEREQAELTIRIVDRDEGMALNERWRGRQGPTNVLSFPAEGLEEQVPDLLGDIIICAPVVRREAAEQHKPLLAHWAHLVVHGGLHLLGYDHVEAHQAQIMEQKEIEILAQLGFPDPYREQGE